jgi:hypothetical protein
MTGQKLLGRCVLVAAFGGIAMILFVEFANAQGVVAKRCSNGGRFVANSQIGQSHPYRGVAQGFAQPPYVPGGNRNHFLPGYIPQPSHVPAWTNNTGKYHTRAEFIRLEGDKVYLRNSDGEEISVPLARLSVASREQARRLHKKHAGSLVLRNSFDAPPSDWPEFSGALAGPMQVRITNPSDFEVRVGLCCCGRGLDFMVPAGGARSVFVPQGRYDIYFQYSNDPSGLYQGDSFELNHHGVEIQIVQVVDGNYGIRKVN